MILGFDIGNTHIVPIFYNEDGNILATFRIYRRYSFYNVKRICKK